MMFQIQNPINNTSSSLHEALISSCNGARYGGGAFAFVTTGGVNLYLGDEAFKRFIANGNFELIVGIDEITNLSALQTLENFVESSPNLSVRAFTHNITDSIFHPKFCWFRKTVGGVLVVGSGNLTIRGMRKNWEAFSVIELTDQQIDQVEQIWAQWKESILPFLKPVNDEDVRARAEQNIIRRRIRTLTGTEQQDEEQEAEEEQQELVQEEHPEDTNPWQIHNQNEVLVAEIPAGGSRWNQANFNQESFENFFGGTRWNNSYRILLREVSDDGQFLPVENRQAVSVRSHNWRFELGAASGLRYPTVGRPTGIFVRVGIRMFVYILVMPDSQFYEEVVRFLDQKWIGRLDRMRRISVSVQELRAACPTLPLWNIQVN